MREIFLERNKRVCKECYILLKGIVVRYYNGITPRGDLPISHILKNCSCIKLLSKQMSDHAKAFLIIKSFKAKPIT